MVHCHFVDLDPRSVRTLRARRQLDEARRYLDHVLDQAVQILRRRKVYGLFATPRLLEALGERLDVPAADIRGVY